MSFWTKRVLFCFTTCLSRFGQRTSLKGEEEHVIGENENLLVELVGRVGVNWEGGTQRGGESSVENDNAIVDELGI